MLIFFIRNAKKKNHHSPNSPELRHLAQTQSLGHYTHFTLNPTSTWQRSQSASARVQRGILGVPVRHSRNPDPGLKNQKVLHGTFPVEGGGRTQSTLKSFRKSPGNIQHAIKRVVRGVVRSKHARRRHGRSADKIRHKGLSGASQRFL